MTARYTVEWHLANGATIREEFTEEQGMAIAARPGLLYPRGMTDAQKPDAAIVTNIARGLEEQGFVSVFDSEGTSCE